MKTVNLAAIEPVSGAQMDALLRAVHRAHGAAGLIISGLMETDIEKGRRPAGPDTFEMWTKNRHKLTIVTHHDGTLIVTCSREPDPEYPL